MQKALLLQEIHILRKYQADLKEDLNVQIANEMSGEWLSTRNMFLSEGTDAGIFIASAYNIGATAVAENIRPWRGLGGKPMSDYAAIINRATIQGIGREVIGHGAVDAGKVLTFKAADALFEEYGDARENYGRGTMAEVETLTDRMQNSYNALSYHIKILQQKYRAASPHE